MTENRAIRAGILGVVAALVAGLVWFGFVRYQADQRALQLAAGETVETKVAVISAGAADVTATPVAPEAPAPPPQEEILVHVAGAVVKSGVYRLPKGARVADAIAAAGGAVADGVPDALNLAEGLADGQKVLVPTKKELESAPAVAFTGQSGTSGGSTATSKPATPTKVNVNTGTVAQLDALPNVTPTVAKNIVDYRTKYGPFKKLEDLDKVSGIGAATLEKLRPYLTF